MIALSSFLPFVLPFVHDCSAAAAQVAIRFACIEFCKRSGWLRYEMDPVSLVAGVAEYELQAPQDHVAHEIVSANLDGTDQPLLAKDEDWLQAHYGDWRAQEGTPRYYTQISSEFIRLAPSPDEALTNGLRLMLSLRPSNDAIEVDSSLYERFAEAIGYGARARLKEMAGQPYYDPANAPACWDKFYQGVEEATAARRQGLTRAVLTVQMRRFV